MANADTGAPLAICGTRPLTVPVGQARRLYAKSPRIYPASFHTVSIDRLLTDIRAFLTTDVARGVIHGASILGGGDTQIANVIAGAFADVALSIGADEWVSLAGGAA
jgi:hypothetical protein